MRTSTDQNNGQDMDDGDDDDDEDDGDADDDDDDAVMAGVQTIRTGTKATITEATMTLTTKTLVTTKPWRYRLLLNNTNANAIPSNIAQLQYNTIQCNMLEYCLQCTPIQMKKNLQCCSNGEKNRCKSSQ